jgi:hypothetical protein
VTKLSDRPTGDILLLMIAGTVSFVLVATALTLLVAELVHPESDTSGAAKQVGDTLAALVALLAGFLAGRSGTTSSSPSNETRGE